MKFQKTDFKDTFVFKKTLSFLKSEFVVAYKMLHQCFMRSLPPRKFEFELRRLNSTIYALSSGHGKCGVAVIRVTGPSASAALTALTPGTPLPPPRVATLKTLRHPETREGRDLPMFF